MIKFPNKPEGCFWRVRQQGSNWFEVPNERHIVVELREKFMDSDYEFKSFGPFEWRKDVKVESSKSIWSHTVELDKPFYEYSLDFLQSVIEVGLEMEYAKFVKRRKLDNELFDDYV